MVTLRRSPPPKPISYSPAAVVMKQAAQAGTPFCEVCERAQQPQLNGN
jgi:hypothetical protein